MLHGKRKGQSNNMAYFVSVCSKFKANSACLVFVRLFGCVCVSVSLCLFPLSNFSDLLCFIYSCSGPNRGHYITIVKSHGLWLLFDDDIVEVSVLVVLKYL